MTDLNDIAPPRSRAKTFNRVGREQYVEWLCSLASLEADDEIHKFNNRVQIDNYIETQINKPEWVKAAETVLYTDYADSGFETEEVPEDEEEEVVVEDNPFTEFDYDAMTVAELREICRERGLTVRGTKAEVTLRLRRDDDGIVEEETVQPDTSENEAPSEEAAEETLDAPAEEAAVTEEVTTNAESSEQEEDTDE